MGFESGTVGVYDLDYRWNRVRYLLWDLPSGVCSDESISVSVGLAVCRLSGLR